MGGGIDFYWLYSVTIQQTYSYQLRQRGTGPKHPSQRPHPVVSQSDWSNGGTSMVSRLVKRAAALGSLLVVLSAAALAQTTHIEGAVKLKDQDGAIKLVP